MPTREAIANTIIPQKVEAPIPTRTVSTRSTPRPQNTDQVSTNRSDPAAASAPTEESVKLSPQLSILARQEQKIRERERVLKEREKSVEADLAEAQKYKELKAKLTAKDYSEAEALGLNYDEYTKYKVDKLNGEDPNQEAIKALTDKIAALEKGKEEDAAQAYEDTIKEYKKEISALTASTPEFQSLKGKYEEHILQNITDSWETDGEEVTIAQSAKDVLEYLKGEKAELDSLFKTPEVTKEAGAEKQSLPPPKSGLKTLTQQITTGSEKRPLKSLQHLSESERYAEARRRVLERREKGN
jgi:hypothetical protein